MLHAFYYIYISLNNIITDKPSRQGTMIVWKFLHAGGESREQSAFKMFIFGGLIEKEET